MKKILGLDLGTNSIGWAVVDSESKKIEAAGSRIIPMDAKQLGDFESGNSISFTAERTKARGARRLRQRFLLRRERLLRVLKIMDFLPEHYASHLDRYGKLQPDKEPKIAWREGKTGVPEFLFKPSFDEMVAEFRKAGITQNIPYDWTIYYLRKKGLSAPLTKEELAWVLLQFNQKRGYNQLRGKNDDDNKSASDKKTEEEYYELKIVNIEESDEKDKKGFSWYNITLENGWVFRRVFPNTPDWLGKTRPFIATFKLDNDGIRSAQQPSLRSPNEADWGLYKLRTQSKIDNSKLYVGEYIFDILLHNPSQKIIGEAVRTIDRHYYYDELRQILKKQSEFIPQLSNRELYQQCIEALYPSNIAYRKSIANRDFTYLFADDILFYQRPLKSKLSLIANCPFEHYGDWTIKCIAKSHPTYQEFRIWQFLANLRIYCDNTDITATLLSDDDAYTQLYDYLSTLKSIEQKQIIKYFKIAKDDQPKYRWNYVEDKEYPMGETRSVLLGGLRKAGIDPSFLTTEKEYRLWLILYSIDDTQQYKSALKKFAKKQDWDEAHQESFVQAFQRLTVYTEKKYGAYSEKAIKRLLPLMRRGKYWDANNIDTATRSRIEHIITGEADDSISTSVREKFINLHDINQCQGLNTWEACYLVYNRHSEAIDAKKWTKPEDIDQYLDQFRQHSLNNPIVEQVVTETLRVVRDIWRQIGQIDEIHIELGRDLNKTKDERKRITKDITDAEKTNQRIRLLLLEMMNPDMEVSNVRPYSPSHYELMKIYEDGVFNRASKDLYTDENERKIIESIRDRFAAANKPTHADVLRYKLWLDQKYISPYTGRTIPLAKLFTDAYQIEHIIPQSRWFDDSLSNKVICEAEVNNLKDRQLGHEFIVEHHGEKVPLSMGGEVEILSVAEYERLVNEQFKSGYTKGNRLTKYDKLMLDDIPESFTERQMNDTRYISRLVMHLLSNIVRTEDENGNIEVSTTSKNVIPCIGKVTERLKQDWGAKDVWNHILLPRFERMNEITHTTDFTTITTNGHTIPSVPLELRQGFNIKRLDHRHHAMDAIIIACCTREHINLINNEAANSSVRYDLQRKLRNTEEYLNPKGEKRVKFTSFKLPWDSFPNDLYNTLQNIIVSFKQNLRVINKTINYITYYNISEQKHETKKQEKGDSWAIRKSLHKDTVFGKVNLQLKKKVQIKEALKNIDSIVSRELKDKIKEKKALGYTDKQIIEFLSKNKDIWSEAADGKIEVYYYTEDTNKHYFATRKTLLSVLSDCKNIADAEKAIKSITDTGIQSILRAHLANEGNNPIDAFSADGLERMNNNIKMLNSGRDHMPIKRVRIFEQANKFSVGNKGQKAKKFVEAADGTLLFYAICKTSDGTRKCTTIPLYIIIDLQKKYKTDWKAHVIERLSQDDLGMLPKDASLLYILSPYDLVYVPNEDEPQTDITTLDTNRIYKVVSFTKEILLCIPFPVAYIIAKGVEFEAMNKMGTTIDKKYTIKETCLPIQVDRLGNIIKLG